MTKKGPVGREKAFEAIACESFTVGKVLEELFKSTGLNVSDYARRVGLGKTCVKHYLDGSSKPSLDVLSKVAIYHKVAFLIHGSRRRLSGKFTCMAKMEEREV